jgi:MoaA/NifB/PqqE/SkfB family radical SAM enzyme
MPATDFMNFLRVEFTMDTNLSELPFLSNIGFMLTYKCTIACPHCIVKAGPNRKEEMNLAQVLDWIDQASAYRNGYVKGLALTGGEPFYNIENLSQISDYGKKLEFIVSVVSNAFWATTKSKAKDVLSRLPAIQMISLSTDIYHQKFIPFKYVKNAIWACKELGRLYNIAVCTDYEENPEYLKIIDDLKKIGESDKIRVSITYPVGRAQKKTEYFRYTTTSRATVSACSMASSPVVFPDGRVTACIGPILTLNSIHPLLLGNLQHEKLSDVLERSEVNTILHIIRTWGPQKLVSMLQENGFGSLLPQKYIENCICDVCYKLMSDVRILDALQKIVQDEQIKQTIAYARLYYLNEATMAEKYHLYETAPVERKINNSKQVEAMVSF